MDKRCNVLIINDFASKGGAEEVYRTSAQLLRAMPGVKADHLHKSERRGA
ncbi:MULTISPECIES: hypothetical protein [Burkholderiaceae]|nr:MULTISPECIES: hypothetical protein [Burkholderiaceae]